MTEEILQDGSSESSIPVSKPFVSKNRFRNSKKSSISDRLLPSLSRTAVGAGPGVGKLRYIRPNDYLRNPSSCWKFPPLDEVLEDFQICCGNLDVYLEVATKGETHLYERFLFDLLALLKTSPTHHERFKDLLGASQETRTYRIRLLALEALERSIKSNNVSPQMIKLGLEAKLAPAAPVIPAAKTPEATPVSTSLDAYLLSLENDNSEEGQT
jgi:hypothetical protein